MTDHLGNHNGGKDIDLQLEGLDLKGVRVSVMNFNSETFTEEMLTKGKEIKDINNPDCVTWINVESLANEQLVMKICSELNIHPLVQDDILRTDQRPKLEDYGHYMYAVIRMIEREDAFKQVKWEQVSILLGSNWVISFQEREGDIWDPLREKIRNRQGRVRDLDADFLAYSLLDMIVDEFFLVMDDIDTLIDSIEEKLILNRAKKELLNEIYGIRRELVTIKKSILPLETLVTSLRNANSPLISEDLTLFLQDLQDHVFRVIDSLESHRDSTSAMIDMYLTTTSIKMNEVMQVLTVISTIFIPLTFITGFYGMNFEFMPEIHEKISYPIVIGIMVVLVIAQLIWFRRKRWI